MEFTFSDGDHTEGEDDDDSGCYLSDHRMAPTNVYDHAELGSDLDSNELRTSGKGTRRGKRSENKAIVPGRKSLNRKKGRAVFSKKVSS